MVTRASTEEIANDLVDSLETVRSHINHILQKLGVYSRSQAIAEPTSSAAWARSRRASEPKRGSRRPQTA
jgi:hypothetical protein